VEANQFLIMFTALVVICSLVFVLSRGRYRKRYTYTEVKETRVKRHNPFLTSIFYWNISTRLTYLLARFNITANQTSALSLIFGILAAAIFATTEYPHIIIAGLLATLLFIFDLVDGEIARLKGQASIFGLWVDHVFGAGWNTLLYLGIIIGSFLSEINILNLFVTSFFLFGYFMNYSVFIETRALLGKSPKKVVRGKLSRIAKFLRLEPNDLSLTGDIQATLILSASILNQMKILILFLSLVFNIQWITAFSLVYHQNKKQHETRENEH
jgi:phosphatidylglycerophosphate synthase